MQIQMCTTDQYRKLYISVMNRNKFLTRFYLVQVIVDSAAVARPIYLIPTDL